MDHLLPEWALPFGDADAANDYWDLVCEIAMVRWGDDVTLSYLHGTVTHADGRLAQLHNIAPASVNMNHHERRQFLYQFFSSLDELVREREKMKDWSWVAPRLRRRLQANWEPGWQLETERIDSVTSWVVAINTDSGCAPAAASFLDDWDVPRSEVWERATAQSLRPKGLRRIEVSDPRDRIFCFEGDLFTSGIASDLTGRFQRPLGEHGAMVCAPTAHFLYVLPLQHLDRVANQSLRLVQLGTECMKLHPNHISPSIFWYRRPGALEPLATWDSDNGVQIGASEPIRSILMSS